MSRMKRPPLPLGKPYKIPDAAVVCFLSVLGKEAARYLAGFAMITHALAAQPALGTTIRAGAIFDVFFFHAFHDSLREFISSKNDYLAQYSHLSSLISHPYSPVILIAREASTVPYSAFVSNFTVTVNVSLLPVSLISSGTRHEYRRKPSAPQQKGMGPSETIFPLESLMVTAGSRDLLFSLISRNKIPNTGSMSTASRFTSLPGL
jgi:hypothetical protein